MKILIPVEDVYFGSAIVNFLIKHRWPEETEFRVVNVCEQFMLDSGAVVTRSGAIENADRAMLESSQNMVDEVALYLKEAFPGARVTHDVVEGHVKHDLPKLVSDWQPDLIVAGSHGRHGFNQIVLGSTSLDLLGTAPCPVLLVKPDGITQDIWSHVGMQDISLPELQKHFDTPVAERQPHKVIIAVDDTDLSSDIADFVLNHHWPEPVTFKLITVVQPLYWMSRLKLPTVSEIYKDRLAKRQARLTDLASQLRSNGRGWEVREEVSEGNPKQTIVNKVREWQADLVIAGCHAETGSEMVNIGSVGLAIMCTAPCSTLLLRQKKHVQAGKQKEAVAKSAR